MHVAASRPAFSALLARVDADPRIAAMRARHGRRPDGASPTVRASGWLVLGLALAGTGAAHANDADDLVVLINAFRAGPPARCDGVPAAAVGPLAPSATLSQADEASTGGDLGLALRAAGYRAASATSIIVGGAGSAAEVARIVERSYCGSVLDVRFVEIGVARTGNSWRLNLARPLLPLDLALSAEAGRTVLELVNEARRHARRCGDLNLAATHRLTWNDALAAAALGHSEEMARLGSFSHTDRAGGGVGDRARHQGYAWRVVGENIAAGLGSPAQVVAGWLASPGHCANIMAPEFAEMGAAYVMDPKSELGIYWTQAFGRR